MGNSVELYAEAERLKEAGDLEGAVKKLQELIEQDANHATAHMALAVYLGKLGRYEESAKHATRCCQLEPNEPFNYTAMSVIMQRAYAGTQDPQYKQLAEQAMERSFQFRYQRQ